MIVRCLRTSCIALALVIISVCASAVARPVIGVLPFDGGKEVGRFAIPNAILWELGHIPGPVISDIRAMVFCIELDRLQTPTNLNEAAGYSRLASATGVDYLVTGTVEHQDPSRVRFRVAAYSSTDPKFSRQHIYDCRISDLMSTSVAVAKDIASDVGVSVDPKIRFDVKPINLRALRLLDLSIGKSSGCEHDIADTKECMRLAERAQSLCPGSPMVCAQDLSWSSYTSAGLEGFEQLHQRDPQNLVVLDFVVRQCFYLRERDRGKGYAKEILALDPKSDVARVLLHGGALETPGGVWRQRFQAARIYSTTGDVRRLRAAVKVLEEQCPRSAYVRYQAGVLDADVLDWGSATCEYEDAVRLNPDSFRLQMKLIRACLDAYQEDKALIAAERALKRWPKRSECHAVAAKAYRTNHQDARAVAEMRTALKLDPDASVDRAFMARQDMRSGDIAAGLKALSSAGPGAKQAIIVLCLILVFVFVVLLIIIGLVVRHMLTRDRKPKE